MRPEAGENVTKSEAGSHAEDPTRAHPFFYSRFRVAIGSKHEAGDNQLLSHALLNDVTRRRRIDLLRRRTRLLLTGRRRYLRRATLFKVAAQRLLAVQC